MSTGDTSGRELLNDTVINVATLLQEPVGSTRSVHLHLDSLVLDDDLVAMRLDSDFRLIRLRHHVLADGTIRANVELECVRCLTEYNQAVKTSFSEQFRQTHDVQSGVEISEHRELDGEDLDEDEDKSFVVDEGHELDLTEALRQNLVLALPMTPVCGDECPGPPEHEGAAEGEEREGQFDVLARLLDDEESDNADTS